MKKLKWQILVKHPITGDVITENNKGESLMDYLFKTKQEANEFARILRLVNRSVKFVVENTPESSPEPK
jgi:hypothetical protein